MSETTSQSRNTFLTSSRLYPHQHRDWVTRVLKRKPWEILNGVWNFFLSRLWGKWVIFPTNSRVYLIWFLNIKLFIYCWGHDDLCPKMYSLFTHRVINFEIPSTVPVCCIAIEWNVTLFPAEHKKLRFRHKLLCGKL